MRVLVVEDHAKLASALAKGLRNEGMAVDVAFDGEDALAHVAGVDYDVVVLDRDLLKIHGDDVCRALVDYGHESRILMLTAASSVDDRVEGLGLGADDYLAKPFAFKELVARVRALARRTPSHPPALVHGDLSLDTTRRIATCGPSSATRRSSRPCPRAVTGSEDARPCRSSHDGQFRPPPASAHRSDPPDRSLQRPVSPRRWRPPHHHVPAGRPVDVGHPGRQSQR